MFFVKIYKKHDGSNKPMEGRTPFAYANAVRIPIKKDSLKESIKFGPGEGLRWRAEKQY